MAQIGTDVEAVVAIGSCTLCLPVVLVVVRSILTLAVAVDVAIHTLTHRAVYIAVGVVCLTIYHLWVVVAQPTGPEAEHIPLVCLVLCFCLSIPLVEKSRLYLYVKHVVFLTIVIASMACQLRLAVVELQFACHFCRQLADDLTAAEDIPTVHHQAYGLVVPEELAVVAFHPGQLLYQFGEACALLQLEGFGVEHDSVAHHRDAWHLGGHFHFLQHERRGLQTDYAEVGGVSLFAAVGIVHLAVVLVSYHAEREEDAPFRVACQPEASCAVGLGGARYRPSRLWVHLSRDACPYQDFARFGVYYLPLECVGAAYRRHHEAECH